MKMNRYEVRVRYAGSVLVTIGANNKTKAQEKGLRIVQNMNSDTFLSALELQHLETEVTQKCRCEPHTTEEQPCNRCKGI